MMIASGLEKKLLVIAALLLLSQPVCAGSFRLGSISSSPVAETRKFSSLANYLAGQLKDEGIAQGKVVVVQSIPAMASFLQTGQVDLYIDSIFPSWAVSRICGSKLLLRRWKMGKSDYRSVIFAQKDSAVARLEDLKGKVIAFEEPFGSSGYFFPKMALLEKGLRLTLKRREAEPIKADEVGYIFSHSDTKTMYMVMNGVVAAGATDDQKYFTMMKNRDSFRIVHETASFPRHIVSHRADLPAKLGTRVKTVLLNMHQNEEGRRVLEDFESTAKFEEIPVRDISLMAGLKKYVDAELKLQR